MTVSSKRVVCNKLNFILITTLGDRLVNIVTMWLAAVAVSLKGGLSHLHTVAQVWQQQPPVE